MRDKLIALSLVSVGLIGCPNEKCGDGVLQDTNAEVCDDGNTAAGDGCDEVCLSEGTCGNLVVDQGEACDDGAANGDLNGDCTNGCTVRVGNYQATPTAVTVANGLLFVSIIHIDDAFQVGDGEIVIIDRGTRTEVNRIPTSAPQPQFMTLLGNNLIVSNTGVVQFINNFTDAIALVPGSVDVIDVTTATTASTPDISIPFERSEADPRQGTLGRIALGLAPNDGLLGVIGSGLTSDVYVVDPINEQVIRAAENPANLFAGGLDTVSVFSRLGGTSLYANSFNTDQTCFTQDTANFVFGCTDIGQFPIDDPAGFEGLKDIAFTDNGAFFALFSVAGSFASGVVNADGSLTIVTRGATGAGPERALAVGDQVFVANAFDNSIQVFDVDQAGVAVAQAQATALPAGSNPRDIALEDQIDAITQIYVANFSGNNVIELNLTGGAPEISGEPIVINP
jgi:cysteine-rich repeat protein